MTSTEFDNIDGLYPICENGSQDATSIQMFYYNIETDPFGFLKYIKELII